MPSILGFRPSKRPTRTPSVEDTSKAEEIKATRLENRSPAVMEIFNHGKDKRHSLDIRPSAAPTKRKGPKESPQLAPVKPASLEIDMESPPIVFYGPPGQSTGALLSGQLVLTPNEPEISIKTFEMVLQAKVTTKHPVKSDCADCTTKTTELFRWKFLSEPAHFARKKHNFPFSYLLPGHIPATSHGFMGVVDYLLSAEAITNYSEPINVTRYLKVQRALMPGIERNSTRIFPPTNLVATVAIPSVVYPIGDFPVQLRVAGVVAKSKDGQVRWRIRRMNWRIDETSKMISEACKKHAAKIGGEGKGVFHEDTIELGRDDVKEGWKTDYDTEGGNIEVEFQAGIRPGSNPLCDVESPTGYGVHHTLAIEIIVAEEHLLKNYKHAVPTGSARVLRMHFKLIVTERAGLGISWDEEQPPMYEDVPGSPPTYAKMTDYVGDPLPDEPLDTMR